MEMTINSPMYGIFNILYDIEDDTEIKKHHWSISAVKSNRCDYVMYYAITAKNKREKAIMMHRLLMENPDHKVVDHINGNTFDNRKFNLRVCSSTENKKNCKVYKNNTTGHKGVFRYPWSSINPWMATISINNKQKTVGFYNTYEEAVNAREEAEKQYYGEFVRELE